MSDARGQDIVQLTAFVLGDEEYVVDILRVREIIRPLPITPVRQGPAYVEGVINLRGAIIPIVDMRRRFGLPEAVLPRRKIIVLTVDGRVLGLVVDEVTEVVRVPRSTIRPAPGLLSTERAPFFLGVCPFQNRELILLNVRNIVTSDVAIVPQGPDAIMGRS